MKRREGLAIGLILALAVFLRLFRLGQQSLWIDEINAVILSGKHIFKIIFTGDTTPPFIYLVNHFWQKFGNSDFMVRLPSVGFGLLSIYAAYKLAKAFFSRREALFSAFLISISLYHIIYSQEAARPYSAFMFFSLLSLYYLYQALNTNRRKYWSGFIIFNTLNLYTHNFAIFVLAEGIIISLIFNFHELIKGRDNYKKAANKIFKLLLAVTGILIFCLPISLQFLSAARSELAGGRLVFNLAYYKNLLCRYGAGNGLALFIYTFFFLCGLVSIFRGNRRKEAFLLIFCLAFPFFILSFMELKHFFHIRYVIFTYPLYIFIVSKGVSNIIDLKLKHRRGLACAAIVTLALLSFIPLKLYYSIPARLSDWKGAADYIYNTSGGEARVITQQWHDNLVRYYLAKKPGSGAIEVVPHHNDLNYFSDILSRDSNRKLYYVGYGGDVGYGTDEFSMLAERSFSKKEAFFSPGYLELGKRELIDWDGNSWVNVGARGYRLVVYSN